MMLLCMCVAVFMAGVCVGVGQRVSISVYVRVEAFMAVVCVGVGPAC